jgi:8-oxo-dGTP pyrophosphatase MutT (NUDIX family)
VSASRTKADPTTAARAPQGTPRHQLDDVLFERIMANLSAFSRVVAPEAPPGRPAHRAAAVALTLVPGPAGEPCFLLTRRASDLAHHPGQFALPGGRLEADESTSQAARRELAEELGVSLGPESVLGLLDDFTTHSGFVITPVVLWGAEVKRIAPDPREVAIAYRVPLLDLYRPEVPVLQAVPGADSPLLSLPLVGTHIFSPTAAIVYQLREVALEGRSTRVQHFGQPSFAWR